MTLSTFISIEPKDSSCDHIAFEMPTKGKVEDMLSLFLGGGGGGANFKLIGFT